jgi:hypothetical protein
MSSHGLSRVPSGVETVGENLCDNAFVVGDSAQARDSTATRRTRRGFSKSI